MPTPIPQPFTYIGLPNKDGATAVQLTDDSLGPVAAIWLLMTTNRDFATNATTGLPNADVGGGIATTLGVTYECLSYFVNLINSNKEYSALMNDVTNAFQDIVHDGPGYTGASCPGKIDTMKTLFAGLPAPGQ